MLVQTSIFYTGILASPYLGLNIYVLTGFLIYVPPTSDPHVVTIYAHVQLPKVP